MNPWDEAPRRPPPFSYHLIELLPPAERPVPPPAKPRWGLALLLFGLTFLTTTTLGAVWFLLTRTDVTTELFPLLTPRTVAAVWTDRDLLAIGLSFSLPALGILLAHEMGHYLACRRYRIPCTPPFFLPIPINFGTFGAFIRIKAPIRSKRELFDVGIAGPIAGFVALIPFLLYGVARSEVAPLDTAPPALATGFLLMPGRCLALELATRLFHGPLPAGTTLDFHPFALAAWLGLLATAINLLPLGQLDGGHVLYAVAGRLQRRLALPLWLLLGLVGFYWIGWLVWCALVFLMGLRHPPVRDEATPLDRRRRALALLALLMLALSFMPVPLSEALVR